MSDLSRARARRRRTGCPMRATFRMDMNDDYRWRPDQPRALPLIPAEPLIGRQYLFGALRAPRTAMRSGAPAKIYNQLRIAVQHHASARPFQGSAGIKG